MKFEVISITPEKAQEYLSTNTDQNRKISKTTVARYAKDMIMNRWQSTGEAIKFDETGRLIDGQHRLSAIVSSKKTVQMLVIHGLPEEVIQVIDTGKSRTAADALTIAGHNGYSNEIASLARKIIAHQSGTKNILDTKKIKVGGNTITNQDIVTFCEKNDLTEHVRFAHRMKYQSVTGALNHGEFAFFHWYFSQVSPAHAEDFLTKVATLEDVSGSSPIRALLQKLTRSAVTLDGKMKFHAIVTAWNAWRTGQMLTSIHVGRLAHDAAMPQAM